MRRSLISAILAAGLLPLLPVSGSGLAFGKDFSGASALEWTRKAVAFGPRPAGSPAIAKLRAMIVAELKTRGAEVTSDRFTAQTPDGPVAMENVIAKFPGKSGRAVTITGHYDTLKSPGFVGANDGGSSAGFLLELAAALQGRPHSDDLYLVFFDGEEAVRKWSDTDSLYGSRHLAEKWTRDGTNAKLKALINIDMIGDKKLELMYDGYSARSVRDLIWQTAASLGYASAFPKADTAVEDDHIPFLKAGVLAVDLIDFESQASWWHTPQDSMDKLAAHSFDVIGAVVLKSLEELEQRK